MAVDEALLIHCALGPTLRLYTWERPSISLGYRQKPGDWLERAQALDIECVRRVTGGGTVLHGLDLTYAVAAPRGLPGVPDDMRGSYTWVRECLLQGLRAAGMCAAPSPPAPRRAARAELCFSASTGLEIDGAEAKLVGSAQRRTRSGFLQHGSIRYQDDSALARRVFGESPAGRPGPAPAARVLQDALIGAFDAAVPGGLRLGALRDSERLLAQQRAHARRASPLSLPALTLRTARALADTPA